ncbi:MAG: CoA transferase, partial [Solirubrobacteraceae bacterium]|nr:CoA transferase [Solirubrobacteraceae bacterium]
GDGRMMVIAANKDTLFRRLCEAMGRPELADDPKFIDHQARGANQDELDGIVADWAASLTADEIDEKLATSGVVCGPVNTIEDVFNDPQVQAREMLVDHTDPVIGTFKGPSVTPKFSATPGAVRWSGAGEPGEHNDRVFGALLDRDPEALAELRERGVI